MVGDRGRRNGSRRGPQGVAAVVGRDPKPGKGPDHGGADGGQARVPGQDGQQVVTDVSGS
jgi:hypothetical protein